jgi:RTX calcium-binding nonapeptide repeat (4 copies)
MLEMTYYAYTRETNRVRVLVLDRRTLSIADSAAITVARAPGCSHVARTGRRQVICRVNWVNSLTVVLGPRDDTFSAARGPRVLPALLLVLDGAGDDVVLGAASVQNDAGDDVIRGAQDVASEDDSGDPAGAGDDVIAGTPRADSLNGGLGNDRIVGYAGNDIIDGGPGADLIFGGLGNDDLKGGDGIDRVFSGPGRDRIDGLPAERKIG